MDIKKKELNLIYCTIFFIVGIAYALLYLNGNMEGLIFALMPGIVLLILSMIFSSQIGIGDGIMIITLGLFMNVVYLLSALVWAFIFVSLKSKYVASQLFISIGLTSSLYLPLHKRFP